jgi:adenylate cyclase
MNLFESYKNGFEDILSKKIKVTPELLSKQRKFSNTLIKENVNEGRNQTFSADDHQNSPMQIQGPKVLFRYDKELLKKHFGNNKDSFENITIGKHPDFADLTNTDYKYHYCVSAFIDIKGSTRLIEKYSLLEVRLIKDSLLTLAIEVANQFGGHVQRLQGDGIFLQFVRKDVVPNDAVINALNAVSILTQFVSVDLSEIMKNHGLRPLKIRAGVDYGDNENVLWSYYGVEGCEELTTTSLHTDMAAKLQAKADDNSILIGGNVKNLLDLKKDFYDYYRNNEGKEMVYYYSGQSSYPFYVFNWKEYLYSLPFIWKVSGSDKLEIKEKEFRIRCFISDDNGENLEEYYPNSKSISKDKSITFKLYKNGSLYFKKDFEKIEWYARNSGKQATDLNELTHDFKKKYNDKTICNSGAAYLGHHYVECKIIRNHQDNMKFTFPIFVQ